MSDNNYKKYEGAVSVTDDVTPITRQPIDQVDAEDWGNLNVTQLWDQRVILQNRLTMAQQYSTSDISKQIMMGIARLDALIEQKHKAGGEIELL